MWVLRHVVLCREVRWRVGTGILSERNGDEQRCRGGAMNLLLKEITIGLIG